MSKAVWPTVAPGAPGIGMSHMGDVNSLMTMARTWMHGRVCTGFQGGVVFYACIVFNGARLFEIGQLGFQRCQAQEALVAGKGCTSTSACWFLSEPR